MIGLVAVGLAGFLFVGAVAYFITIYNGLVVVKNNIAKAWANIDVLLKQRHDEIPKLISTLEASMKFEKSLLERVIGLRNSAQAAGSVADKAAAENALSGGLRQLFAVAENYPDIKSQQGFQQLQGRITGLESQIADRREFYNESVNNYNIRIQSLPDVLVAGFMGLAQQEMFKVSEDDRKDVSVSINVP